jgi:hypothetical protein
MNGIISKMNRLPFRKVIWILPIFWAFHEAEEWNIISWYQRHFVNPPEMTPWSVLTLLVCSALASFIWTFIASLFRNLKVTAGILLFFFIPMAFMNAIQHILWAIMFHSYSPGVLSSVILIIPAVIYITWRVLEEGLLPKWYIIILYLWAVPRVIETIIYGNEVMPMLEKLHYFGNWLAKLLWGTV